MMTRELHCEACGAEVPARCFRCDRCGSRAGDGWAADLAALMMAGQVVVWVWYAHAFLPKLIHAFHLLQAKVHLRPWLESTMDWQLRLTGHGGAGILLFSLALLAFMLHASPKWHRLLWWQAVVTMCLTLLYLLAAAISAAILIPNWYGVLRHPV